MKKQDSHKKFSGKKILTLFIIIVLLGTLAGAFLYFKYYEPGKRSADMLRLKQESYQGVFLSMYAPEAFPEDIYPDYGDIRKEFKLENMVLLRYSKLFRHFYNQKILDPFYKTEDLFNNDFSQLIVKIGEKIGLKELAKLDIVNDNMLIDVKYNDKKKGFFSRLFGKK